MSRASLSAFLRDHRSQILDDWERRMRNRLHLTSSQPVLRDSVPEILDTLAEIVDHPDYPDNVSQAHGLARYTEGYEINLVLAEYRELRQSILHHCAQWDGKDYPSKELLLRMHEVFDDGIIAATRAFTRRREEELETFVAILGHDLRNPLNRLAVGAQVLRAKLRGDPVAEAQEKQMARAAHTMKALINDLLNFARVRRQGRMPVSPKPGRLDNICERVIEETHTLNPGRDIELEVRRGLTGCWDEKRIEQALTNLVRNAVEHADGPVRLSVRDSDDEVRIDVSNRGHIPAEALRDIFDPYRSHGPGDGLGLGLYIVRMVADAHGGTVDALCQDGEVRITMMLPREPQRAPEPADVS